MAEDIQRFFCKLRPIGYDQNGKCYPMDMDCKDVPENVCKALQFAYDFATYDRIRMDYRIAQDTLALWDADFGDKYPRSDCPEKYGKDITFAECGICSERRKREHGTF